MWRFSCRQTSVSDDPSPATVPAGQGRGLHMGRLAMCFVQCVLQSLLVLITQAGVQHCTAKCADLRHDLVGSAAADERKYRRGARPKRRTQISHKSGVDTAPRALTRDGPADSADGRTQQRFIKAPAQKRAPERTKRD